jgi:phosphoribosylamine--glycine ligase
MVSKDGSVKVLEFNCRLGDPEAQVVLMRLKSDLLQLFEHGMTGKLDQIEAEWDRRVALCVVLAAANYPAPPRTGDLINGLPEDSEDVHVFHAGTVQQGDKIVSAGGRVLGVTALGDNIKQAQKHAYDAVLGIHFEGMQYRRDIGNRAIVR